uniref:Ig-like domain-containing protein n=1 Tax=Myripristis murdjan TaxID=586833 RepID=A0A667ZF76_9TELE
MLDATAPTVSLCFVNSLVSQQELYCFFPGQYQLFGPPQPIVAILGGDIILPCHLEPAVDVAARTVEWSRPDLEPRFVHMSLNGQDLVIQKHPSYERRTSLFTDKLKHGDISLKLSEVKLSDKGRYRCFIPLLGTESAVELVVVGKEIQFKIKANTTTLQTVHLFCTDFLVSIKLNHISNNKQTNSSILNHE